MTQSVTTNGTQSTNFENWALANQYNAGDSVIYNGSVYVANANIPTNTVWATGTSGATWSLVILGTVKSSIVQITNGVFGTVFYRTSDGKIYGAQSSGTPEPGVGRNDNTNWDSPSSLSLQNASPIMFYDSTLDYEETGKATYVGIHGFTVYVLFDSGNLWGWGRNDSGQLGLGNTTSQALPRRLATGVAQVYTHPTAAGASQGHLIRGVYLATNGKLYGCGRNDHGQLGLGNTTNPITSWTELTWAGTNPRSVWNLGQNAGCLLVETNEGTNLSKYKIAGYNWYGNLGTGNTTTPVSTPADVTNNWTGQTTTTWRIKDVTGGFGYNDGSINYYSSIIMWIQDSVVPTNSKIKTCGANNWYQLGTGNSTDATTPQTVSFSGTTVVDVAQISSPGGTVSCPLVLMTNGDLWTWGDNRYGGCGLGNTTVNRPVTKTLTGVSQILFPNFAPYTYDYYVSSWIRKTDGSYWATGLNDYGQLATGETGTRGTWTRMRIPSSRGVAVTGWMYPATGGDSQAINPIIYDTDGILWSWGRTDWRTLGTPAENTNHWWSPNPVNPPNL